MCNGTFDISSEPGVGTTTEATFQHSHIDRPPLGDLAGTLLCMIVGFAGVDVLYEHHVDDREFVLDTREIRAILGDDIPFSDPDVLAFLNESLHEGWASLQGETN